MVDRNIKINFKCYKKFKINSHCYKRIKVHRTIPRAFKRTAKSPYESRHFRFAQQHSRGPESRVAWGPFLETSDNFPGLNTILGAQYCPVAVELLLIFKAKF